MAGISESVVINIKVMDATPLVAGIIPTALLKR